MSTGSGSDLSDVTAEGGSFEADCIGKEVKHGNQRTDWRNNRIG